MTDAEVRAAVREEVAALLAAVPNQTVRALLDQPNAPDHYGLPERLQSARELQESVTFPILQAVKAVLTDPAFLKNELFPAWDAAAKGS